MFEPQASEPLRPDYSAQAEDYERARPEYPVEIIARYAEIERAPGSVLLGEFERIFGKDVEKDWRDFLERRQKGS